jgi:glycerophosphoryl diester phosphodiesterase
VWRLGLVVVRVYAVLFGPCIYLIAVEGEGGRGPEFTRLVEWAHERNLGVHPYTFRADALPSYVKSFDELLEIFLLDVRVDGIFTDFPDRAVEFLQKRWR